MLKIYRPVAFLLISLALFSLFQFTKKQNQNSVKKKSDTVSENKQEFPTVDSQVSQDSYQDLKDKISKQFQGVVSHEWSERATGVKTRLDTNDKVIALTFDACGGSGKDGYDEKLINYLTQENVPATLFIGGQWIKANPQVFGQIAVNPLFEIENHGYWHIPCSVSGKSAYGIVGEKNAGEVVDEIEQNAEKIEELTGRKPLFYRAGTAFTDEICPQIAGALGVQVVNFNVLGDAGATYSAQQIVKALSGAKNGSIALLHMNHPEKETAEGIAQAILVLRKLGFRFVKLSDYPLR